MSLRVAMNFWSKRCRPVEDTHYTTLELLRMSNCKFGKSGMRTVFRFFSCWFVLFLRSNPDSTRLFVGWVCIFLNINPSWKSYFHLMISFLFNENSVVTSFWHFPIRMDPSNKLVLLPLTSKELHIKYLLLSKCSFCTFLLSEDSNKRN